MLSRFSGPDGPRRLLEAMNRQVLVGGDADLAAELARVATVRVFASGEHLISQGGADNAVFFLCAGAVSVRVKGREVAVRGPGEHVGEMALIDPAAPRSASVIAIEATVAAEVGESDFIRIANANPRAWRAVARTLAERLRQRDRYVRPRGGKSGLFVGCSVEALPIARAIQAELDYDPVITTVWTNAVFGASRSALEELERQLEQTDFALLILSPDDTVTSRGKRRAVPRDNVVFELGLFAGALGRDRTFMLVQRGADLKLPSDLIGFTPLEYSDGDPSTLAARIAPSCDKVRQAVLATGPR